MSDAPQPPSEPLILRRASKRVSGTWGPEDWDVFYEGRDIGRISKAGAGVPPAQPWMWTITGALVKPSHGFCVSLHEAKAKFAEGGARGRRDGPLPNDPPRLVHQPPLGATDDQSHR